MKQKPSLLRGNIEKLSKPSVRSDTLDAQKTELKKAESALSRKEQRVFILQEKVRDLRALSSQAKLRHKESNTTQSKKAAETAARKLRVGIQQRNEAVSQFRDMKQVVRDQRVMYKKLQRKEAAKQKAVAQFLKQWEREYDREIRLREKKAKQRRRWLESD